MFDLKLMKNMRQNFSLTFPIKCEAFTIVVVSNHGNKTNVCLPEFKDFQRIAF